jgi:hypothetical protein
MFNFTYRRLDLLREFVSLSHRFGRDRVRSGDGGGRLCRLSDALRALLRLVSDGFGNSHSQSGDLSIIASVSSETCSSRRLTRSFRLMCRFPKVFDMHAMLFESSLISLEWEWECEWGD